MSIIEKITGKDLIALGYEPGPLFSELLDIANSKKLVNSSLTEIKVELDKIIEREENIQREKIANQMQLQNPYEIVTHTFIDNGTTKIESDNIDAVFDNVIEMNKTPTIVETAIMPDACPVGGPLGTIPVGVVTATYNAIHPGMHSSDICCSMFLTEINEEVQVDKILDAVQKYSHFGYGGSDTIKMGHGSAITKRASENKFLASVQMFKAMNDHIGTQGDGNHFFFVGRSQNTGKICLVTHHGSRKPGALLYKDGMRVAELFRKELSPETPKHNAWIPYNTWEGEEYWEALQIIREWTKHNHTVIHDTILLSLGIAPKNIHDRFWNEHNFVFKRHDLFYHAKGSTPVWGTHAHDADIHGRTIIPLNMGSPILIVKNHPENKFGFAPHGAGRNFSRAEFVRQNPNKTPEYMMKEQVSHIDARFYSGKPDISELPGAYKNAKDVTAQIEKYKLAKINDIIMPLGSMMAGELEKPWMKK